MQLGGRKNHAFCMLYDVADRRLIAHPPLVMFFRVFFPGRGRGGWAGIGGRYSVRQQYKTLDQLLFSVLIFRSCALPGGKEVAGRVNLSLLGVSPLCYTRMCGVIALRVACFCFTVLLFMAP